MLSFQRLYWQLYQTLRPSHSIVAILVSPSRPSHAVEYSRPSHAVENSHWMNAFWYPVVPKHFGFTFWSACLPRAASRSWTDSGFAETAFFSLRRWLSTCAFGALSSSSLSVQRRICTWFRYNCPDRRCINTFSSKSSRERGDGGPSCSARYRYRAKVCGYGRYLELQSAYNASCGSHDSHMAYRRSSVLLRPQHWARG